VSASVASPLRLTSIALCIVGGASSVGCTSGTGGEPAAAGESPAPVAIRCTNPYSGTSWTITLDSVHRTVDRFPARISPTEVRWDDTVGGGHYDLDRTTGALRVIFASSTGGYTLNDHCELHPAGNGAAR
jgi:hypothetical protein